MNRGQNGNLSVVVIDGDGLSRSTIKNHIAPMGARVIGEAENFASGMSLVSGLRPEILILELPGNSDQVLDTVRALKTDHPDLGIVVTANDASPQLILRSMRVGAQEFLTRPIEGRELIDAVKRLSAMTRRSDATTREPGKVVAVFSGKGGVGVTSVAANLGVGFAAAGKKTVIVDLNLQMGDLGLMFDLRPTYSIADAIGSGSLDVSQLKGLMTEHESGVFLLSAPDDPIRAELITPGLLLEIFSLLKSMFETIVVDAGHHFDTRVLEVLNLADCVLVLSVLDVPTVRNVRRSLALFGQLGYTPDKVKLVVNRQQKKTKVTIDDLEKTAETEVFWQIPNDYKTLIEAIDTGVPALIQSKRSKMSISIEDLTQELCRLLDTGPEDGTANGLGSESEDTDSSQEPNQQSAGR